MAIIKRTIIEAIRRAIISNKKVIIIYGPRQSGKTTLINALLKDIKKSYELFLGDDLYAQELFHKNDLEALKRVVGSKELLVIDEAQRIESIGLSLKLLIDNLPLTILVSGSASFDLANKINEPLTGRTKTFWLYPFSWDEIKAEKYQRTSQSSALEEMLRFGMYPKVCTLNGDKEKEDYLYEYLNNYLYKDILIFERIRKPKKVIDLLSLLALQIGKEVVISELAQNLALSQKAVVSYLDILEKMFVIYNLRGFSRNLRKEVYKNSKYYFIDVGLRNALIRNFNPLNLRQDVGELFENWFITERIKLSNNQKKPANFYFWRTYDQKEIDLIEEREGKLFGYECKWRLEKIGGSIAKEWLATYKGANFELVNSQNYEKFLSSSYPS